MIAKQTMKKRLALLFIAGAAGMAIVFALLPRTRHPAHDKPCIIDKKQRITPQDYWNYLDARGRVNSRSAENSFADTIANEHTLDFFSDLQGRFKDMAYDEHMRAVRRYLHETIRPPEKAEEMYRLYGTYNNYQKEIYLDQKRWNAGGTPEKMLENLREIQELRRRHFGKDTADSIFGVEVKGNEYALRKQIIIGDTGMAGAEKEKRLASLRRDMWGDQGDAADGPQRPLDRYNEKLKIYEADLASMTAEERDQKIREFRRELFTPEEAERMESADLQLKLLRARDSEYSRLSRSILDDKNLSEQEKNRRIRELHNRIYGTSKKAPDQAN